MCVCTSVQGGRENERQGGRVGENTKPVTYPTDRLTAERERERTKSESESESETYRERASGRESARAQERERERERRYNPKNPKFLVENIPQFNKRPECPFQSSNHACIPGRLVPSGPVVLVRAFCQQSSARGGLRAILESAHPSEFAVSNYSRFVPR